MVATTDEGFKHSEQLSFIKFKRICVTIQLLCRAFAGMHRWDKSFYWEAGSYTQNDLCDELTRSILAQREIVLRSV